MWVPQNGGRHAWFRQPADGEPLGNRDKAVKDSGINVRGSGGFVGPFSLAGATAAMLSGTCIAALKRALGHALVAF